ncbi:hypothetical protein OEZ86_011725 [Tetradesmus obliquus]|nr:hypothetical protein OEZ86_011725 [Tetradesmus obliquus]
MMQFSRAHCAMAPRNHGCSKGAYASRPGYKKETIKSRVFNAAQALLAPSASESCPIDPDFTVSPRQLERFTVSVLLVTLGCYSLREYFEATGHIDNEHHWPQVETPSDDEMKAAGWPFTTITTTTTTPALQEESIAAVLPATTADSLPAAADNSIDAEAAAGVAVTLTTSSSSSSSSSSTSSSSSSSSTANTTLQANPTPALLPDTVSLLAATDNIAAGAAAALAIASKMMQFSRAHCAMAPRNHGCSKGAYASRPGYKKETIKSRVFNAAQALLAPSASESCPIDPDFTVSPRQLERFTVSVLLVTLGCYSLREYFEATGHIDNEHHWPQVRTPSDEEMKAAGWPFTTTTTTTTTPALQEESIAAVLPATTADSLPAAADNSIDAEAAAGLAVTLTTTTTTTSSSSTSTATTTLQANPTPALPPATVPACRIEYTHDTKGAYASRPGYKKETIKSRVFNAAQALLAPSASESCPIDPDFTVSPRQLERFTVSVLLVTLGCYSLREYFEATGHIDNEHHWPQVRTPSDDDMKAAGWPFTTITTPALQEESMPAMQEDSIAAALPATTADSLPAAADSSIDAEAAAGLAVTLTTTTTTTSSSSTSTATTTLQANPTPALPPATVSLLAATAAVVVGAGGGRRSIKPSSWLGRVACKLFSCGAGSSLSRVVWL